MCHGSTCVYVYCQMKITSFRPPEQNFARNTADTDYKLSRLPIGPYFTPWGYGYLLSLRPLLVVTISPRHQCRNLSVLPCWVSFLERFHCCLLTLLTVIVIIIQFLYCYYLLSYTYVACMYMYDVCIHMSYTKLSKYTLYWICMMYVCERRARAGPDKLRNMWQGNLPLKLKPRLVQFWPTRQGRTSGPWKQSIAWVQICLHASQERQLWRKQ